MDRLGTLAQYLQKVPQVDNKKTVYAQAQRALEDLLDSIHAFFFDYESEKRTLWRLAQTGRVVQQVESFHRALDAITARCGLIVAAPTGIGPSLPRWQSRWRRMRAERLVFLRSYLDDHESVVVSNSRIRRLSDQLEVLTLLKHSVQKFDTLLTTDELKLLEHAYTFAVGFRTNSIHFDTQLNAMCLPEWFVAPYDRTKQRLKWQRAAVIVQNAPEAMNLNECFTLASIWSCLQHSHILKLYGACHVGQQRFFVVAEGTPLTRCSRDDGFPLWRALHEAAKALQYLHERRIGLSSLSCADLILFRSGDCDAIKLAGYNMKLLKSGMELLNVYGSKIGEYEDQDPVLEENTSDVSCDDVDMIYQDQVAQARPIPLGESSQKETAKRYWQAPELASLIAEGPTEESDIYALGMCVIEAFSGGNIWSDYECCHDGIPPKPAALEDTSQWNFVERMCSFNPKDRPRIVEVVASFQAFASDEQKIRTCFSGTKLRKKARLHDLNRTQAPATSVSIACTLSEVHAWCDEASESSAINYQLYERMDDIAAQLEGMDADKAVSHLPVLANLTLRFRDLVQRHVDEKPLLRLAATRHVIEMNAILHGELDVLMSRLALDRLEPSIHSWNSQQASYTEKLWKRLRVTLSTHAHLLNGGLDGNQELALLGTMLAFEVKNRSASYAIRDLELMKAALDKVEEAYQSIMPSDFCTYESRSMSAFPPWFIPPYEVVYYKHDGASQGASSAGHFGRWMNVDVVVKEVLPLEQPGKACPLSSQRGAHCTSSVNEPTEEPSRQFKNEMTVWSALKHPNVLKLLGACHMGQHQFFVCEYAAQGSVDIFLASQPGEERTMCAHRVLHEMALGLHYLHAHNVVHADLRCCNILVDAKGVVKLADFGFSSIKPGNRSGEACQWKAPECLTGEMPTFASNVYSFAMCAIEVVSGVLPFGCELSDAKSKICKGLLPPRPTNCFSDADWNLIKRMCSHDPKERITMSDVVKQL
uniref:Protein kinase domain-containing protein n=1 Tax=Hyaloperonospora arabidopsidis (strain Emoy2) TaxID=559515 RepID=M4B655_HYAAE